jgi:hypothetical protein
LLPFIGIKASDVRPSHFVTLRETRCSTAGLIARKANSKLIEREGRAPDLLCGPRVNPRRLSRAPDAARQPARHETGSRLVEAASRRAADRRGSNCGPRPIGCVEGVGERIADRSGGSRNRRAMPL